MKRKLMLMLLFVTMLVTTACSEEIDGVELFSNNMAMLTTRKIRCVENPMTWNRVTAGIFTVRRSDQKPEGEYTALDLYNQWGIYHLGYIVKDNGRVISAEELCLGAELEQGKYYILPIENEGISYVCVMAYDISEVLYEGKSVEFSVYRWYVNDDKEMRISFFLPTEEADTSKIELVTF